MGGDPFGIICVMENIEDLPSGFGRKLVFDRWRRASLFALGVMISGFGIALSTRAGLGATPISSVPWVLTHVIPISYGLLTLAMNLLFVAMQIALLRRSYDWFQLWQIPATALFGVCIDIGMWASHPLETSCYPLQALMLVAGAALLAAGICCQVMSDFLCVPGDAFVKAFARYSRVSIARVKIGFDATLVAAAIAISMMALRRVEGVREGTIASVFIVGWLVGLFIPHLRGLRKWCYHWVAI